MNLLIIISFLTILTKNVNLTQMPRFSEDVAMFKVCVMIVRLRHTEALVANKAETQINEINKTLLRKQTTNAKE